jgi:L-ascorbate metabolism protein UlaG (beta-lactamase superfamily)
MLIEWHAHSCFRVTLENGIKIVLDPFDNTLGYDQPQIEANIVLESHQHHDHNCTETLKGDFKVITSPGEYAFDGFTISGYETFHDNEKGALRGKNTVFALRAEGMTLCHMGDLGHIPSEEVYEKIGHADILMIPVGGKFTINAETAFEIISRMQPNITLPMHYRTMHLDWDIDTVHAFLELCTGHFDISRNGGNSITASKDQLKKRSRITVLEYI